MFSVPGLVNTEEHTLVLLAPLLQTEHEGVRTKNKLCPNKQKSLFVD